MGTAENNGRTASGLAVFFLRRTLDGQDLCGKSRCRWLIFAAKNSENSELPMRHLIRSADLLEFDECV
jgi:hypothetical protein